MDGLHDLRQTRKENAFGPKYSFLVPFIQVLHSVTQIAELFLELQQAGELQYSTAVVKFKCAVYEGEDDQVQFNENEAKEHISTLQTYIKSLETKLGVWKESVLTARTVYYELNYFTTLQLLTLRKELGLLMRRALSQSDLVKPSVLMLLQSVSPDVTSYIVQKSVQEATLEDGTASITAESMSEEDQHEAIPLASPVLPLTVEGGEKDGDHTPDEISLVQMANIPTSSGASVSPIPVKTPQVSLTVNDLTAEQHEIFTNCVSFLGHSESHVLRAFQESSPDANMYDIEQWCDENEDCCIEDDSRHQTVTEADTMIIEGEEGSSDDEQDQEEVTLKLVQDSIFTIGELVHFLLRP